MLSYAVYVVLVNAIHTRFFIRLNRNTELSNFMAAFVLCLHVATDIVRAVSFFVWPKNVSKY